MYFKSLNKINVKNKKVLVRVDLNVPIKDGKIVDDFKLKMIAQTIEYLLKVKAKIILASHFGRPIGIEMKYSMQIFKDSLSKILNKKIVLADDCIGSDVKKLINETPQSQIILLENLRFYPEEELNDPDFAKELADLADVYINEAFSACHREHASIVGIPKYIPGAAGFLLSKEINVLSKAMENPEEPFVIIMGGAKVKTKLNVISRMLKKSNSVLLGGVLASVVLSAKGVKIGKSETFGAKIGVAFDVNNSKLLLPLDAKVSIGMDSEQFAEIKDIKKVSSDELILDIGPETIKKYVEIIREAKTIIWNGPMGYFENEAFVTGTKMIAKIVASSDANTIIGGGDTIAALAQFKLLNKIKHISTGGGAMLAFIGGESMPGIDALS